MPITSSEYGPLLIAARIQALPLDVRMPLAHRRSNILYLVITAAVLALSSMHRQRGV